VQRNQGPIVPYYSRPWGSVERPRLEDLGWGAGGGLGSGEARNGSGLCAKERVCEGKGWGKMDHHSGKKRQGGAIIGGNIGLHLSTSRKRRGVMVGNTWERGVAQRYSLR